MNNNNNNIVSNFIVWIIDEIKELVFDMINKSKIIPDEPMMNMILENCF